MAAAGELALEEGTQAGPRDLRADDPRPEAQHVGVVVLTPQASRHRIGGLHAADAAHLVRHDRFPGPAPAQHDPALELSARHRPGDRRDEVRIVDRLRAERAEVAVLDAQLIEQRAQVTLEMKARVVGADRDAHGTECTRPWLPGDEGRYG